MKYKQGQMNITAIAVVFIIVVGVVVTIIAIQKKAPISDEPLFLPINESITDEVITDQEPVIEPVEEKPVTQELSSCLPTDPPSITVTTPSGGESYTIGQQVTIEWTSCNVSSGSNVVIFLVGFEGMNSPRYNANVSAGSYTWTVPDMSSWGFPGYNLGFNAGAVHAQSGTFSIY